MSETIKTLFSDIAPTYDQLNRYLSFTTDKGWRKKAISFLQMDRTKKLSALDLCAGTYDFTLEFLKKYPHSQVTALDFSQEMLNAGMKKLETAGVQNQVNPVCGDALHLPFESPLFDIAFCGFGMRNLDNVDRGLQELFRVIKPGGEILILEFFPPEGSWGKIFHRTYARHILPTVGRWISGHDGAYTYLRDSILGFKSLEEFAGIMEQTGFKINRVQKFIFEVATCIHAQRIDLL